MPRPLEVYNQTRKLKIDRRQLAQLVELLDTHYHPKNTRLLSLAFVSHQRLAQMHADFCGDPTPTDIITFPVVDGSFGELCISPQAAREYINTHGGTFNAEMKRYVIHGYLHLIGYDDITPAKRTRMKKEEARMLRKSAKLKIFSSAA